MILALAAITFTGLIMIVVSFQIALAVGAPWGEYAMGGKYPGTLPAPMRVAALIQSAILAAMAVIVLVKSGLVWPDYYEISEYGIWIVLGVTLIASVLNLITRSKKERRVWAPTSLLMLLSTIIVMLHS